MAMLETLDDLGSHVTGEDAFKSLIESINDLNALKDFLGDYKDKDPALHQIIEEKINTLAKEKKSEEDSKVLEDLNNLGYTAAGDILKEEEKSKDGKGENTPTDDKSKPTENKDANKGKISKNVADAVRQTGGGR